MAWLSTRPVIVTVYVPGASPVVSMLAVTTPSPSGPVTVTGWAGESLRGPVRVADTSSQVWPGTVEVGSANGGPVTPNWPGSGGNTPKPSSIPVPFGDLPGM